MMQYICYRQSRKKPSKNKRISRLTMPVYHFRGSNGWLESFKSKHEIVFSKLCSESASVSKEMCEEWILDNPALVKGYRPKDIFNADKTGLFYQCLPDKTAMFKNEECREGKQSEVHTAKTLLVSFQ